MRRNKTERPKQRKTFFQKKTCRFCADKIDNIDYKDVKVLKGLLTERGKIIPSRISGNCSYHQRKATLAIKRARHMALIPFTVN
ncbi:SSU ribosomal protein S18p @ SSU ribosomal protein S18p, zinc-independent [hydrothermal vent metagenome]|uniref:SSU ribosomal protein S18p @ SSU ribosomal protein S18p, zinc-independent n=1 Tax=hydrothermal vent metagenome TaxID=652676 RepID=A0A3B1BPM7_9ZZZZ